MSMAVLEASRQPLDDNGTCDQRLRKEPSIPRDSASMVVGCGDEMALVFRHLMVSLMD
jgi:hypothetical protein